jgi:hypothetical protein
MAFPLTTPNTVAARISILLDLRGESVTLCGGSLSGGHALGAAVQAIRGGYSRGMLAGGTTAVEEAFLDALRRTHPSRPGELGCGACLFFLEPGTADGLADSAGYLLGYAEGFGAASLPDAIRGSLDDAGILPEAIGSVWTASMQEWPAVVDAVRRAGVRADVEQSRWRSLHAASFPLTVGGALGWSAGTRRAPVLVVGNDCLVGAAAAVIRGGV